MDHKEYFRQYGLNTPEFTLKGIKTFARVVSIYDADTVKLVIPVLGCFFKFNVRLLEIDACEMKSKNKELAIHARDRLFELVTGRRSDPTWKKKDIESYLNGDVYLVWVECVDFDKWGRVLANIYPSAGGKSFSQCLLEENLAYPYQGGSKLSEDDQVAYLSDHRK